MNCKLSVSIVLFILCAAVFSGCSTNEAEIVEIKKAVRDYNDGLLEAYSEVSMEPLMSVAGEKDLHRNEIILEKLKFEKTRMNSSIREFNFQDIKVLNKDKAVARTHEKWAVELINSETGEVKKPEEIIVYDLEYTLSRTKDGGWIVDEVKTVEGPR